MLSESIFILDCVKCGSVVSFAGYEGACPKCKVQIRVPVDWNLGRVHQSEAPKPETKLVEMALRRTA
jgi:hypothetical protein